MRKFILNESDDTLKYYVKESKEPKAVLRLSELNVAFAPAKIEHKSSMQLTFLKDGTTRHIYLYHDDPEVIVNWYMAIRCAKLHRLQVAFPSATESDLVGLLSHDFAKEVCYCLCLWFYLFFFFAFTIALILNSLSQKGWISKTGPRQSDGYKRRWFTLDNRKLMYHDDRLDAYPKGEIFLGNQLDGYSVRIGVSATSAKNQGYPFTLFTPERIYNLSCATEQERDEWIKTILEVLQRPLTPQDSSGNYYNFSPLFSCRQFFSLLVFPPFIRYCFALFRVQLTPSFQPTCFSFRLIIFVWLNHYHLITNCCCCPLAADGCWFIEDNTSNTNQCHKYSALFSSIY